jgi:lipopolysaccharide transport system ATP-binding protein
LVCETISMSQVVIKAEDISKQYRLGEVGTGALAHDVNRWLHRMRGREDPYLKIGDSNDRTVKGMSEYVWALKDINFEVKQGDVLGIIGRNGAGKSTLLKILSKTTTPTTGQIKIKGRIASLLEVGTGFHPELSGRDNIFLNGAILGMTKREIKSKFDEIVDFAGVERYIDTPVKRYSSGMYVRLAFGVAAHLEPEILIVDEVLAVGDAEFQKKALGKMKDVSDKDGRTVLFVSHNLSSVQHLCTRAIMMEQGRILLHDNTQKVLEKYILSNKTKYAGALATRTDRTGNGKVMFSDFYVEDASGQRIEQIIPGTDISFVFLLQKKAAENLSVDLGIAISTMTDERISILYSSYQNIFFEISENQTVIKLRIPNFSLSKGTYKIVGRLMNNGEETDSIQNGIGELNVTDGDFYHSGNFGDMGVGPLLISGKWES